VLPPRVGKMPTLRRGGNTPMLDTRGNLSYIPAKILASAIPQGLGSTYKRLPPHAHPMTPPFLHRLRLATCLALFGAMLATTRADDTPGLLPGGPRFGLDMRAMLAKGGCNAGTCHGNASGKGGFKLSLRGEDPAFDFLAIAREGAGRRIDLLDPAKSLVLEKATLRMPHLGGRRFANDSALGKLLRDWLAAGAPAPSADEPRLVSLEVSPLEILVREPTHEVQIRVLAIFNNGARLDATSLAVYEPVEVKTEVTPGGLVSTKDHGETTVLVRFLDRQQAVRLAFLPASPPPAWTDFEPANYIDRLVDARLQQLGIRPSGPAADGVFLRRMFLDGLGILPSAEEAREFAADRSPAKREAWIDRVLARPEFADHWALRWSDILRNEEKVLDVEGVTKFHGWLRAGFAAGMPLDELVHKLVAARGSTYTEPPANYYRALRDPFVRAETTARLFLGARIACAKCHNHPFDRWTQDDYYSFAAMFSRVDYQIVKNERRDKLDLNEFAGEQIVKLNDKGSVTNDRTKKPATPRLLDPAAKPLAEKDDPLVATANWLTAPENKQFARVQANFIWYHLLGRGLVEPIDDFRPTNPAVYPELLDALADDLRDHGHDLRHLVRRILRSRVYQTSAEPNEFNRDDDRHFAKAIVRRLTAEQLLDAQSQVLDRPAEFASYPLGTRAGQIAGAERGGKKGKENAEGDRFLKLFGKPARLLGCECERSNETTLAQTFALLSSPALEERLIANDTRVARWAASDMSGEAILRELYWTALGRDPTAAEIAALGPGLSAGPKRLTSLHDVVWGIMNSREFLLRH